MTDIVERLRDGVAREASGHSALWDSIMAEAADEIERLNKQIASMNHAAHAYDGEVERLTALVAGYSPYSDGAMKAENEKLRAALDDTFLAGWDHYNASRSRMDMPRDRIGALNYWKAALKEQ